MGKQGVVLLGVIALLHTMVRRNPHGHLPSPALETC